MRFSIVIVILLSLSNAVRASEDEKNGRSAPGASDAEIQQTLQLRKDFLAPSTLAFGPDGVTAAAKAAKEAYTTIEVVKGDQAAHYDVIIQPGHFGRTSGRTGGEGKYVSEQQYVAWVTKMLLDELKNRKVNAIAIPADGYTTGLTSKMFLAMHTDAANLPCSVGPSVAYATTGDGPQMHTIALGLALSMEIEPAKFMRDNYTKDEASYYAYKTVNSSSKGLLEMGELTCPSDEKKLLSNAEVLAKNLAIAIIFAIRPSVH